MNKRIIELKEERNLKIEELKTITNTAEQEKRFKTPEELEKWNALKTLVDEIDAEVKTLETEESLAKEEVKKEVENEVENKETQERKFDVLKALNGFMNRNLSGYELEMHERGVAEMQKQGRTPQGLVIPASVMRSFTAAGFDNHFEKVQHFSASAEGGLLDKLGVTVFNGATATIGLNFTKGMSAGIYAEGVEVTEGTYAEKTAVLQPKRVQGWKYFSKSYLAQTATTEDFVMQINAAIEKAITEELLNQIIASADMTISGRGSAATKVAVKWSDMMDLQAGVEVDDVQTPRFVANKSMYHKLKTVSKDAGSGLMLMDGSVIDGVESVNAGTKLNANTLIYGDFSQAYAAFFDSGIEILVDPYTASNSGKVKITFVRMADVKANPYAFKSIQNLL